MISDTDYTVTRFSQAQGGLLLVSEEPLTSDTLTFKINVATPLSDENIKIRGLYQGQTPICTNIAALDHNF